MYKYKAILVSSREKVAEANTLMELEGQIKSFRRGQKRGEHTRANEKIEIIHNERNNLEGKRKSKEELIKIV